MKFSVAGLGVAVLCVVTGGCYRPAYRDCELQCSSGRGCPAGLTCDSLTNQCRAEGASCDGVDASIPDVAVDASVACAVEISATRKHTCVRRGDGSVVCWGLTQYGEAGASGGTMCDDGGTTLPCNPTPTRITLPTPTKLVGTGDYHSCAVLTDDAMWCWGNNGQQRFGNNLTVSSSPPVDVGRPGARAIAAGNAHTCTLGTPTAGAVMCSGENAQSQVGDGTMTARPLPVMTASMPAAVAISSGFEHSCAITNTGVWCWGVNDFAQSAPTNPVASIMVPTSVAGTSGTKALTLGLRHTCFITSTDGVRCFGYNSVGQLGLGGNDTATHPPGDVLGLTVNVGAIASGYYQTCAVKTDGSVWCWGHIGGNTISSPTNVSLGGKTAKKIAVGTFHACAILSDDTVACWGDNDVGQLGDGTTTASTLTTALVCP